MKTHIISTARIRGRPRRESTEILLKLRTYQEGLKLRYVASTLRRSDTRIAVKNLIAMDSPPLSDGLQALTRKDRV